MESNDQGNFWRMIKGSRRILSDNIHDQRLKCLTCDKCTLRIRLVTRVLLLSCLDQLLLLPSPPPPPTPRPSPNEGEELVGARDYVYAPSIDNQLTGNRMCSRRTAYQFSRCKESAAIWHQLNPPICLCGRRGWTRTKYTFSLARQTSTR